MVYASNDSRKCNKMYDPLVQVRTASIEPDSVESTLRLIGTDTLSNFRYMQNIGPVTVEQILTCD